jgi:hypothetical protein
MDGYRLLLVLLVLVGLVATSGASCPRVVPPQNDLFTRPVLPPSPTLDQIITAVNGNSNQIQSFAANRATITGPGMPALRASVFFQQPRRFRLRAETALTGPEFDLGSNDELFWLWVRRNQPQALYYCRHEQYPTSPARRTLGIEPDWLVEALGITRFDPSLPHQGPFPKPGGRYEIRTISETPDGPSTKITIVDGQQALVVEQHLLDAQGQLVASAVASQHRRDPLTMLVLPRVVDIRWPKADLTLRVDLGVVEINRISANTAELWSMPQYEGWPAVDLCNPNLQFNNPPPSTSQSRWRGSRWD